MSQFDQNVPRRIVQDVVTEQPNPAHWSDDLKTLMDPNIVARSFVPPAAGSIVKKNPDFEYYWCRLKMGPNADTSRFMQLKAMGYQLATTEDVEIINADIVAGTTEIRSGDRVLVKAPPAIHNAAKKQYMLDAIKQTSRAARGQYQDVQPGARMSSLGDNVMRTGDYAPSSSINLQTGEATGNINIAEIMARSNPGNTSVAKRAGGK